MAINFEVGYVDCLKYASNSSWNAIAVRVDDAGIVANLEGRKIVKCGTIVGGTSVPVLENRHEPVSEKNDGTAEGVLLTDIDVTNGPSDAAMVVEGYIDLTKLPAAPTTDVMEALTKIKFVK